MTDEKKITISVSEREYGYIMRALKARALYWRSPEKRNSVEEARDITHAYEALAKKIEEQVKEKEA